MSVGPAFMAGLAGDKHRPDISGNAASLWGRPLWPAFMAGLAGDKHRPDISGVVRSHAAIISREDFCSYSVSRLP